MRNDKNQRQNLVKTYQIIPRLVLCFTVYVSLFGYAESINQLLNQYNQSILRRLSAKFVCFLLFICLHFAYVDLVLMS